MANKNDVQERGSLVSNTIKYFEKDPGHILEKKLAKYQVHL